MIDEQEIERLLKLDFSPKINPLLTKGFLWNVIFLRGFEDEN